MNSDIVAAVDGSESARHAALWAAAEADHRHLPLRLVKAIKIPAVPYTGGRTVEQRYIDAMTHDGRDLLAGIKADITEIHPDLEVHSDVVLADPVATLVAESESAAIMVLGSRGLGGFTGILVGSTAVALVAHGHCPVAVIRSRTTDGVPPAGGPVVVGVDGSAAGDAAVELAFEEASLRGTDLVAVHTWTEYGSDSSYAHARQFALDWEAVETKQHEVLAERLAGWPEKYPDVIVRRIVTRDRPVSALLEQSAEAQLLVVGSRGHGGFTGMLLGSTSQALIYHATCPLLVTRPTHRVFSASRTAP
jgi:nucleotide-binding universal stress UspA family protein